MPHGHCYLWKTNLVALHVISDALIVLSYYSIPFILLYLIFKRKDVPFHWMFVMFGLFIFACGSTHMATIWTLWQPKYWIQGTIKAITALLSVTTAILLYRLIPQISIFPSPNN